MRCPPDEDAVDMAFAWFPPSPFFQKPKSSSAKISAIEKQSCTSITRMSLRFRFAVLKAFSPAIFVALSSSSLSRFAIETQSVATSEETILQDFQFLLSDFYFVKMRPAAPSEIGNRK